MATAQTLINRSLRQLGVLASGESPSADETADALAALNAMLDGWMNDKLMTYALVNIPVPLVANTASYTIGASGATVTATAPVSIESAYVRKSNIDYPIELIDDKFYNGIAQKNSTSDLPEYLWFNGTNPNATVTVYPVPNEVNTMYLSVWTPYTAFASAATTVTLPNGYEDAIAYNLTVRLSPEYPTIPLSPVVVELAANTLASIKRINRVPMIQTTQIFKLIEGHGTRSNIFSGA